MTKLRIYYKDSQVIAWENDPRYSQNGEYTDDFHPYIYLVDPNDPSKGYHNVPDWFVCDVDQLPHCGSLDLFDVVISDDGTPTLQINEARRHDYIDSESLDQAVVWKKDQLASVDWTSTPLTKLERKILIGATLTTEDQRELVSGWKGATKVEPPKSEFVCDICGKVCASAGGLTLHKKIHEDEAVNL